MGRDCRNCRRRLHNGAHSKHAEFRRGGYNRVARFGQTARPRRYRPVFRNARYFELRYCAITAARMAKILARRNRRSAWVLRYSKLQFRRVLEK